LFANVLNGTVKAHCQIVLYPGKSRKKRSQQQESVCDKLTTEIQLSHTDFL